MYGSGCQPSKSNAAIFGYHCVIESATPSSEFLPERRTITGTCPSKFIVNVVLLPGNNGFAKSTSKMVPTTLVFSKTPSCFKSFTLDRKSTRLNSSHVRISYAVFCLKKKRHPRSQHHQARTHST